ncbi:SIMPL domain-containing protein [Candidatus Tokpelaia sp.]|uniref:SIMPL domain-containing protein n=1 Tax=Candidatus Tokpelaia sp. TaxID=2233777 RepID=UPI00123BA149|nr:SIMPL domain-containing protein [Candidatus Tokpelaia sp.]KAA6404571.1 hypothetical protein DPQ22_09345 [Candidatus Tokpelaia sp.]
MAFFKNCAILSKLAVIGAFLGVFPVLSSTSAQAAGDDFPDRGKFARITVEAEGNATARPDMALLQVSVSQEAKTAKEAAEETARALQNVFTAVKAQKIDDKDIQSNGLTVDTIYPPEDAKPKREKTFRAGATLSLKIRDTKKLGQVIDAALANGANGVSDISWTNSDPRPFYTEARRQAVANALEKLQTYAQAAGVTQGRILRIEEVSGNAMPPRLYARAKSSMADMPIAEGEETYTVRILLTAELLNSRP